MDGTGTKQDTGATQNSPAASATAQETPTAPQTFTPEQVQQQISAALSRAGRETKNLETARADIAAREARLLKTEQEREIAELDAVKDKPEELSIIQRRQKLAADIRNHNAEVEKRNLEWATRESEVNEAKAIRFELALNGAAEKHAVSLEILKAKAEKLGVTTPDGIEELAAVLPKKIIMPVPDSGKGMGRGLLEALAGREIQARGGEGKEGVRNYDKVEGTARRAPTKRGSGERDCRASLAMTIKKIRRMNVNTCRLSETGQGYDCPGDIRLDFPERFRFPLETGRA